ncbi:hypothetical protein KIW84_070476 [Lathyrus oleraceus]|uniref:RING-type domain-containing protein n=1 Tax=Pisum sativum TaxID=3888 RepID=A0A9D4VHM6_PEA|nr:hypothetical protein KIW84_070476 [Pisum sativum]
MQMIVKFNDKFNDGSIRQVHEYSDTNLPHFRFSGHSSIALPPYKSTARAPAKKQKHEPLTYTPPGSPCGCVWPLQVKIRVSIAAYKCFPLVSKLADEIAASVMLNHTQVRIVGADAANQQLEKTNIIINLIPKGVKFDDTAALLIYRKFWHREILIDDSLFGTYEVLYVHYPGLYLTPAQREAVEALIQELPKFMLKAVPTDCSECPICLEEFRVGNEVRGLPCAHNSHVECIDEWLRLNVKCPRCRCSVFPNPDLSALSNLRPDSERSSASVVTTTSYVRDQSLPCRTGDCTSKPNISE